MATKTLSQRIDENLIAKAEAFVEIRQMKEGKKNYSMAKFLEEAINFYLMSKERELLITLGLGDRLTELDLLIEKETENAARIEVLARGLSDSGFENTIRKSIFDAFRELFPSLKKNTKYKE